MLSDRYLDLLKLVNDLPEQSKSITSLLHRGLCITVKLHRAPAKTAGKQLNYSTKVHFDLLDTYSQRAPKFDRFLHFLDA